MSQNTISPVSRPVTTPPREKLLDVSATSTDITQQVSIRRGEITLTGTADGNTFNPVLELRFDGQAVSLTLQPGMEPSDTVTALKKALPPGYRVVDCPNDLLHGEVFAIVKDPPLSAARSDFQKAIADGKVTLAEVQRYIEPHCEDIFRDQAYRDELVALVYWLMPPAQTTPQAQRALAALLERSSADECWSASEPKVSA
ncbi:MAG: hypothetical protein ACT4TC_25310 [Myxococcaceae bacterium]